MKGFLHYAVRSRGHAIVVSAATLIASLVLLPMSAVTAGLVGLVTLRYGPVDGALVLAGALGIAAAASVWLTQTFDLVILFAATVGVPVLLLACVLRLSRSQGTTLAATGALGGLTFCAIHLFAGDPLKWWQTVSRETWLRGAYEHGHIEALAPQAQVQVEQVLNHLVAMSYFPLWSMTLAMLMLLVARWWHAMLDNPGGFAREFRTLRLDRRIAFATIVLGVSALVFGGGAHGLAGWLLQLVLALYAFQGVALAHSVVAQRKASVGWLVTMYLLLLVLTPVAVIGLVIAGFSDAWLNYRARWQMRESG